MKKQMAIVMAGAMAMTTLPMSVFAAYSGNVRVTTTLPGNSSRSKTLLLDNTTAKLGTDNTKYSYTIDTTSAAAITAVNNAGFDVRTAPVLTLSGIKPADSGVTTSTFSVNLSNGKWFDGMQSSSACEDAISYTTADGLIVKVDKNDITASKLTVTVTFPAYDSSKEYSLQLPIIAAVSNTTNLNVSVVPLDNNTNITSTTYTAAVSDSDISGGNTTTKIDDFTGKNDLSIDIKTFEGSSNTFGTGNYKTATDDKTGGPTGDGLEVVTYTLSTGFEFGQIPTSYDGTNFGYEDLEETVWKQIDPKAVVAEYLNGQEPVVYARRGSTANKVVLMYDFRNVDPSINAAELEVKNFMITPKYSTSLETMAYITVTPATGSSFSSHTRLEAGNYTSYSYKSALVSGSEVPVLMAGGLGFTPYTEEDKLVATNKDHEIFDKDETNEKKLTTNDKFDEYHKTAPLKVSEIIKGSFIAGREIEFQVPEGVEIVGYEISYINDKLTTVKGTKGIQTTTEVDEYTVLDQNINTSINKNVLVFDILSQGATTSTDKGEFDIILYVAAEANFAGDVDVVVTGDALAGQKLDPVKVAEFKPAYSIDTKVTNVKSGSQVTPVADIVITETRAGNFVDGETMEVYIDVEETATLTNAIKFHNATVKVTAGDVEINNAEIKDGVIQFKVVGNSSEISEITISNVAVSTAYGLPETDVYPFQVKFRNLTNGINQRSAVFGALAEDFVNISESLGNGSASALAGAVVQVQPGSTTYLVNGVEKTMDVAPFIDPATSSTMVPVRFIADGVGLTEEDGNLIWSAGNRTVILRNGSEIIEFPVDCNYYRVNGVTIYNENNAVTTIVNDRTFVPFRTMGNALGIPVEWDAANGIAQYN